MTPSQKSPIEDNIRNQSDVFNLKKLDNGQIIWQIAHALKATIGTIEPLLPFEQ